VYSNGLSEVILGKAIKQHKLPRDEIVVMTKVRSLGFLSIFMTVTDGLTICRFIKPLAKNSAVTYLGNLIMMQWDMSINTA
jgi:hypothetical protein